MLEELVKDYAAYLKSDMSSGFQTVQDAIDNMLTRLEELTSMLQMIKLKNSECSSEITEDIRKYRSEIIIFSKKITIVNEVIHKLHSNMDLIETQVEKAELDFGVYNDNKIRSLLKPFLMRNRHASVVKVPITPPNKLHFESVMLNFEENVS